MKDDRRFKKRPQQQTGFEKWMKTQGIEYTKAYSLPHMFRRMYAMGIPKAALLEMLDASVDQWENMPAGPDTDEMLAKVRLAIDEVKGLPEDE